MKGFIVVGDDLQFQNQTVTVGETLQVTTRFERTLFPRGTRYGTRGDGIYRSYPEAVPGGYGIGMFDVHCQLGDGEAIKTTLRPKYRIFECEVGGRVVPNSNGSLRWYCDTLTVTRELTYNVPKATSTTERVISAAQAYAFNEPFTFENVTAVIDKCKAILHPDDTDVDPADERYRTYDMAMCVSILIYMYALTTQEWEGERILDVVLRIYDKYQCDMTCQTHAHLVEVLRHGYVRNANFSEEERVHIRDEIRTWYQQSTHPYTAEERITMMHVDQFLEKLQAITLQPADRFSMANDGTSWTPYWRLREYIATATTQEIEQILLAQTTMGRPIAMQVTDFPSDISIDVLRTYIEHVGPASEANALRTFAQAFPYDASVYNNVYAIMERIRRGDTETMYEHIHHPSEYVRAQIAYYGTDDIHERLMKDKAADVRAMVASVASEDIVLRMVNDRSVTVRIEIAHRGIDDALDVLVHDRSSNVRHAVLDNARPQDVEILRNDTLGTIRKRAARAFTTD